MKPDSEKKFRYAPDTPDGDPWTIILKPMLDSSSAQCDIWKDEVQNLLIFAGLFSAVVTGFLVESYKSLVPDPQDAMVLLLAQIVQRLDSPSNLTAATSVQSLNTPFVQQNPVYNRINGFWFLSLILSLATVLIGIISLQWLREHRNYSDPSLDTKQIFGIFRIRDEGLNKWKVPMLFELLPVLLQAALVLFLAGMIDFTRQLGNSVFIPAMIGTAFTLLFLVVTTVLPALQKAWIYLVCLGSAQVLSSPSQCPYKSPQSKAFNSICRYALCGIASMLSYRPTPILAIHRKVITQVLAGSWSNPSWQKSDIGWLHLRDVLSFAEFYYSAPHPPAPLPTNIGDPYTARMVHEVSSYDLSQLPFETAYPIFDILNGFEDVFREISKQGTLSQEKKGYIAAAYHCFSQISFNVTCPLSGPSFEDSEPLVPRLTAVTILFNHRDYNEYHHRYFQRIFDAIIVRRYLNYEVASDKTPNLLDCFSGSAMFSHWSNRDYKPTLLHYENLWVFLSKVKKYTESQQLELHLGEVKIWAIKLAFTAEVIGSPLGDRGALRLIEMPDLPSSEESGARVTKVPGIIFQNYGRTLKLFKEDDYFKIQQIFIIATFLHNLSSRIDSSDTLYKSDWRNTPFGYRYIFNLVYLNSWAMYHLSKPTHLPSLAADIDDIVQKILDTIHTGFTRLSSRKPNGPSEVALHRLFFYVSKITSDCLLTVNDGVLVRPHVERVIEAQKGLKAFKEGIWGEVDNGRDFAIESCFPNTSKGHSTLWRHELFSDDWWMEIDELP